MEWDNAAKYGEHTRLRVFRSAPRRPVRASESCQSGELAAASVVGEGANHGTRGVCAPPASFELGTGDRNQHAMSDRFNSLKAWMDQTAAAMIGTNGQRR